MNSLIIHLEERAIEILLGHLINRIIIKVRMCFIMLRAVQIRYLR
jgi:hypothetical protein